MNKVIYSITLLRLDSAIRTRCVGYHFNKEDAIEAVEKNHCDIAERGWYRYAIIHTVPEGIHQIQPDKNQIWFEYDTNTNIYHWIRKPEKMSGLAYAGIG